MHKVKGEEVLATFCPLSQLLKGWNQSCLLQSSQNITEKSNSVFIMTFTDSLMSVNQDASHQVSWQKQVWSLVCLSIYSYIFTYLLSGNNVKVRVFINKVVSPLPYSFYLKKASFTYCLSITRLPFSYFCLYIALIWCLVYNECSINVTN